MKGTSMTTEEPERSIEDRLRGLEMKAQDELFWRMKDILGRYRLLEIEATETVWLHMTEDIPPAYHAVTREFSTVFPALVESDENS